MKYLTMAAIIFAVLTVSYRCASAESIDGKTPAQITVDQQVQATLNKWALNRFKFAPADQPCYFTKSPSGARACSFPGAPANIAALFTASDFQSVKGGSSSWECYYGRPQAAVVLPKMIGRIQAAGLGADPYVGHLEAALAYLRAWYAAQAELPLMKVGGYCQVNIAP